MKEEIIQIIEKHFGGMDNITNNFINEFVNKVNNHQANYSSFYQTIVKSEELIK